MNCAGSTKQSPSCWNDMEELKYLICAIDCCKCPTVQPPPSCSVILPPRIQELPAIIPPQRPPECPPPPCQPPLMPGPCCPSPLPAQPPPRCPLPPLPPKPCCPPSTILPSCPNSNC